jgi:hypothetical protein
MDDANDRLYEADFYAWAMSQADALRRLAETRPNVGIDFPHLIEEVEDLARAERNAVRSQLRRIIEHALKLEYSRADAPRAGWYDSIADARAEIEDKLTPAIYREVAAQLSQLYDRARDKAKGGLGRHGEADAAEQIPTTCPYALDDLLRFDWHPVNRHGLDQAG